MTIYSHDLTRAAIQALVPGARDFSLNGGGKVLVDDGQGGHTPVDDPVKIGEWKETAPQPTQLAIETQCASMQATFEAGVTAAAQRLTTDEGERKAAQIDAQILPLVNQTKAEWITWAVANFPSLTAAERTRLGILLWVVSVGVRRAIRNGG